MDSEWVPFSKYVTVKSSASQEYFPLNSTSSFINKLIEPIDCSEKFPPLEVALVDLWYHPKASPKKTIFGHEEGDDVINVIERYQAGVNVRVKEGDGYGEILNKANQLFKRYFPQLVLMLRPEAGSLIYFDFNNLLDRQKTVTIPLEYAKAMGFENNIFPPGKTEGKHPFSQELLNEIDVTTPLTFEVAREEKFEKKVQEPTDKSVNGLVDSINNALESFKIIFKYSGTSISVDGLQSMGYHVRFSPLLEKIFGLVSPCWFDGNKEVSPADASINLGLDSTQLLVLADIAEAGYCGGKSVPWVEMFSADEPASYIKDPKETPAVHKSRPTPLYVPIKPFLNSIRIIQIQLHNEQLEVIPPSQGKETIATLHFRSRRF